MNKKFSGEISISTFMFKILTFQKKISRLIKCLFQYFSFYDNFKTFQFHDKNLYQNTSIF